MNDTNAAKPVKPIAFEEIKKMVLEYNKTHRSDRTNKIGKEETRSVWVSREDLDKFIAANKKYGVSGIRLYFGVHTENTQTDGTCKDKLTVILVSTRDSKDNTKAIAENSVDNLDYNSPEATNYVLRGNDQVPLCPPHCPTDTVANPLCYL